ncbi:Transposon Tf2-9 polyprotein [Chionoecetes opilio]|uniref:RNA-directed DNA polymerase n=1 Tax=Chionoecetes opilio TaxID=41210 RepID=A0A8J5C3Z0_CHIOP|nr:Transposon Tf2-9 polyprotein [Chionoecetes opilio]
MARELWFLPPTAAAPSLGYMTVTKVLQPRSARAQQTVFWPGIDADITSTVQTCEPCQVLQPSQQQEPLLCDDRPSRPFESVSADFFSVAGKSFLVIADRLSGWAVVVPCRADTTATHTIRLFCRFFREVGVPLRLRTDGGPSVLRSFLKSPAVPV